MAGYEGTAISEADFLASLASGSVTDAAWRGAIVPAYTSVPTADAAPTYSPEPAYSSYGFSPDYFAGSTDDFFRAISGAPSAPWVPGISEPPSPLWSVGGDMETMTLDGTATGAGLSIGEPRVSESMQDRMATAMILPDGKPDFGKWIIVAGVLVTLYLIGREMGRKGSPS